ncbi:MAG TPA: hypothetical protein VGB76_10740 [Pyrinomonadaceae bacterium]|jgi:hypothetical protein
MKSYRNAIAVLALTCVFSTSALAGDGILWTEKTPPPPPPPLAGDVIYTDMAAPMPEADIVTETALNVLQNLLTLL